MSASVYLLRHGEREPIPEGEIGNDSLLTEHGLASSRDFGASIEGVVIQIKSSPIERCIQTAEMIAQASNFAESEIKQCTTLGAPGILIEDGALAWKHWQEKGAAAVNHYLLHGNERWSGFKDLSHATDQMMGLVKQQLASMTNEQVAIWVTHDTVLAAIAARAHASAFGMSDWPGYLGYLAFKGESDMALALQYQQYPEWPRGAARKHK